MEEDVPDLAPVEEDVPDLAPVEEDVPDLAPNREAVQHPQPCVNDQPSAHVTQRPAQLKLEATLDLMKTEGDTRIPLVTGLAFLLDGRIVAVDNRNKTCFVLSVSLQRQGSAFKFENSPKYVICYEESKMAVTLGYVV